MSRRAKIIVTLFYLITIVATAFYFIEVRPHRSRLGTIERDVAFAEVQGSTLRMDIFYPEKTDGPAPVVLQIHGGAWSSHNKQAVDYYSDIKPLIEAGFLVASIDYRLAPQFKYPAQLEDTKAAVRFLRAHSEDYDIDPDRIAAMGRSAGGHLASLLGLTSGSAELEGHGGNQDTSSRVAAVIDLYGPADLGFADTGKAIAMELITPTFGTSDRGAEILRRASPVYQVSPDDPPFLIIQGEKDTVVPPYQSRELFQRLQAAGVYTQLVMVKNAGHEFKPESGAISPSSREIEQIIVDFLRSAMAG